MNFFAKLCLTAVGLSISTLAAADPTGTWRTIDDKTGQAASILQVTNEGGKYVARVVKTIGLTGPCTFCKGEFKNKNLVGQTIMWGVKSQGGNNYGGGRIQDPVGGSTYNVSLKDNGSTMTVRGYIGMSLLGRNQTWYRQ